MNCGHESVIHASHRKDPLPGVFLVLPSKQNNEYSLEKIEHLHDQQ